MIVPSATSKFDHIRNGIWAIHSEPTFTLQKTLIDSYIQEIINKKVLFITGGIGRLASYAARLGVHATSLDYNPLYKQLGNKYYNNVTHITADMFYYPVDTYDYIFLENCIKCTYYDNTLLNYINNCRKVVKILPKTMNTNIYKCNSSRLDDLFYCKELEGRLYTNKALDSGGIRLLANYSDLDDLTTETLTFDLHKPMLPINITPSKNKKYTILGGTYMTSDNAFRGFIFNKGYKYSVQVREA